MMVENGIRYCDYSVPHLVDETLREGIERTAFPITVEAKVAILKSMVAAGLRDFVVGCGPEEPLVWDRLHLARDAGELPADTRATFIILLNCWETAFDYFKAREAHRQWIADTVFSFGMITYRQSTGEFERAIEAFRSIGAVRFKASVLNNFRDGVSNRSYQEICRQIDWAAGLGVEIIRINDSVGSLQPHVTQWLCSRLVKDFPQLVFCLHAHNDNGLALANTMQAIHSGFQMVEGSLAGFGNRSGIAPLEQVVKLCQANNIKLGSLEPDLPGLISAAHQCEEAFLQLPSVYRAVSGKFETLSNYGVLNIPDFLETNDEKGYFVNYVGLHPQTIRQALENYSSAGLDVGAIADQELWAIVDSLKNQMQASIPHIESQYRQVMGGVMDFYRASTYTPRQLAVYAEQRIFRRRAAHG
ncbi:pyruvate carboxyltransferase [Pseudomonas protegens]|uniref:pyruvate carboxyltransferase n=1 Tax=Pseudomonas TaxID=286 RepID=UPI001576657D|nr:MULTISPECIES: pyruvate carboxyltransferase [Pseudomonas]MBB1617266.1 pyruvate carboxyltransferase [Pseudomonas sp. UMC65]MBB1617359.1 pyruvate carboxyltransferase [Pseudomonas sp. UME65]NTZ72184.1 pyruvate carboxyltransferase [Pseudomonas protegens]